MSAEPSAVWFSAEIASNFGLSEAGLVGTRSHPASEVLRQAYQLASSPLAARLLNAGRAPDFGHVWSPNVMLNAWFARRFDW